MRPDQFAPPRFSLRFIPIWRRNFMVWRKMAGSSIIGHLADPVIYMLGLGYGLGGMLPEVGGVQTCALPISGTVCYSTMNSASFEALYSGFARMHEQRTWEAILNTPVTLDDIVFSEIAWAASKSLLSGLAVLAVIWLLGLSHSPLTLWLIPLALLVGLCFASLGLIMTAVAPGYDFFMYYFTLVITPMVLLCGVFFPVDQLPPMLQNISAILPLTHAIDLARPLMNDVIPAHALWHAAVLLGYALLGFYVSLALFGRRLSQCGLVRLWGKSFHIIFVVSWFAGLFYLPRIFVNHAMATEPAEIARLKRMERKLYRFATPIAWLAVGFGLWLWLGYGIGGGWMHAKLLLVLLLLGYHYYCGHLVRQFAADRNTRSHVFYRWFHEAPVLLLAAIVILVTVKPF